VACWLALLREPHGRLAWGGVAIASAIVLGRVLKWIGYNLEQRRPEEERELLRLRRRETALVLGFAAQRFLMDVIAER
jgi:hypothetical protein